MSLNDCQKQFQDTLAQIDSKMVITHQRLHPGLYQRLSSYSSYLWFSKPTSLSAIQCALKGWNCIGKDELECKTCSSRYICHLDVHTCVSDQEVVYVKRLLDSHKETCSWKRLQSPSYTFPNLDYTSSHSCLVTRVESMIPHQNEIKIVDFSSFIKDQEMEIIRLCVPNVKDSILILALLGWESCEISPADLLECFYCSRKIPFKNQSIHALESHKQFCLWRQGYKSILEILKSGKRKRKQVVEHVEEKNVLKLLDSLLPKKNKYNKYNK